MKKEKNHQLTHKLDQNLQLHLELRGKGMRQAFLMTTPGMAPLYFQLMKSKHDTVT